ncbi:Hypothetical_protein [Hexamita inflata]|uniref:Hypothetical_protein n=1 Tax=Hexamita inflata TaxID=28002 RepID=A0AA86PJH0_9EUKA|nr:Hypothetical protein HINF_LOCUS27906 [Hexamita inflata]
MSRQPTPPEHQQCEMSQNSLAAKFQVRVKSPVAEGRHQLSLELSFALKENDWGIMTVRFAQQLVSDLQGVRRNSKNTFFRQKQYRNEATHFRYAADKKLEVTPTALKYMVIVRYSNERRHITFQFLSSFPFSKHASSRHLYSEVVYNIVLSWIRNCSRCKRKKKDSHIGTLQ